MANVSDRNSTDINEHVNDFVKNVDVATALFRKDIKQHVDNKYMRVTKRTGIMIIVKIEREFLIMLLMIVE